LTRSENIDWKDGRGGGGGGSFSLAAAKACVIPAVSGDGIRPGGLGGGKDDGGGVADATRTRRSFGTDFTFADATVTAGGKGGAAAAVTCAGAPLSMMPPWA
jgi:hypothetical protein